MQKSVMLAVSLFAVVWSAPATHAQTVKKSTLSGLMISRSVAVPDLASATVFTTPATGFYILTQFCATAPGVGSVTLSGSTFGQVVVSTSDECTTYNQGITFAPGEVLTCANGGTGATEHCMITGVLETR